MNLKPLLLTIIVFIASADAQSVIGTSGYLEPLNEGSFQNCGSVLARAKELADGIQKPVFMMELFPKSRALFFPFASEGYGVQAQRWLAAHKETPTPFALLYFVDNQYTLRCRDSDGRSVKLLGPGGDPLALGLGADQTEIWHFFFTPVGAAHVFVVTAADLKTIDGDALLALVTRRLGARFVYMYVRNDPWFLGVSPDPLPYVFADTSKAPSREQYIATETLTCYTNSPCKLGPSLF